MMHVFDVFFVVEYDGAIGFTLGTIWKALGAKTYSLFLLKKNWILNYVKGREKVVPVDFSNAQEHFPLLYILKKKRKKVPAR